MSTAGLEQGLWGVVATPFLGDDLWIDHNSLGKLVQRYEAAGATGLTVLGVFGEAAGLDTAEREEVLRTVLEAVELPLVVGVTSLATAGVVEDVRRVQAITGDRLAGAMVQINTPSPAMLRAHLTTVYEQTGAGVVVQNYPVVSGVSIRVEDEIAALEGLGGIVALKEEAPPTAPRVAALTARFDVPVFGGLGGIGLLDELVAGAAGAMTGFSYPEGLLAAVEAYHRDGYEGARAALLPYLPLINFEQQPGIALAIRKQCLVERGLIAEASARPPAQPLPPALLPQLREHIRATETALGA